MRGQVTRIATSGDFRNKSGYAYKVIARSQMDKILNEVSRAKSYTIDEATNSSFSTVTSQTIIGLSASFTKNTAQTCYYRVRANNSTGSSGWSNTITIAVASKQFTLGDKTVTANFEPAQYTLTMAVNQDGWGTVNPSTGGHKYNNGETVTITATPASGYLFVNWTGSVADTSSAATTVTVSGNMTVKANFEKELTASEIAFVTIPGGTFQMGDVEGSGESDEKPVHSVTVSSFEMSAYEITNLQYAAYLNEALKSGNITATSEEVKDKYGLYGGLLFLILSGSSDSNNRCLISYSDGKFNVASGKENLPVVYVTWEGAKAFALYYGLDLPTEAEWEYACRGGKQYKYGTDDGTLNSSKANYDYSVGHQADVGSYPKNTFGLYDMSGNVLEWCHDWYGIYSSRSMTNPSSAQTGTSHMIRGGGWDINDFYCRSAIRGGDYPRGFGYDYEGFRVVRRSSPQNY